MVREVTSAVVAAILAEARAALPRECCGLLLGGDGRIDALRPAANIHPEPWHRFTIDPQALIDAQRAARGGGARVLGYYHAHPRSAPVPSATDRAMARGDGMVWAIAGAGTVRFWCDTPGGFAALSLAVVAR